MIAIIDYGAGNLFSVQNALNYLGEPNVITKDPAELRRADSYILPGVGAYPYAMEMLQKNISCGFDHRGSQSKAHSWHLSWDADAL